MEAAQVSVQDCLQTLEGTVLHYSSADFSPSAIQVIFSPIVLNVTLNNVHLHCPIHQALGLFMQHCQLCKYKKPL